MKIKRFLRALYVGLYWSCFISLIILLLMGKSTILGNIALVLYGVNIIISIARIIRYNVLLDTDIYMSV